MSKKLGIEFSSPDGERLARGVFGDDGLLVLASGRCVHHRSGFVITTEPDDDALVYAFFFKRGGYVHAASARSDVSLKSGRMQRLKSGDEIYIGSLKFVIDVFKEKRPPRVNRLRMLSIPMLILALLASGTVAFMNFDSDMSEASAVKKGDSADRGYVSSALAKEVAELMKMGLKAQAKLAVLEHIERAGGNRDTKMMLEAIERYPDRDAKVGGDWDETVLDRAVKAEQLFKEGSDRMAEGRLISAISKFDSSFEMVSNMKDGVTFKNALLDARSRAKREFKSSVADKLKGFATVMSESKAENASGATEMLAEAYRICEGIVRILEDDIGVMALFKEIDGALEAASGRWLSSIEAAMAYSGCQKAAQGYERLRELLYDIKPDIALEAERGVEKCKKAFR